MSSLVQQYWLAFLAVSICLIVVFWWRHRQGLAIATIVLGLAAWADRLPALSNETKGFAFGLFVTAWILWLALLAFWGLAALTSKWEEKGAATGPKARLVRERLVEVVNRTNKYRRRYRALFYVVCALLLMTVFTFASWSHWWGDVSESSDRDPTSFFWLYIAALIAQVVGVVVTIFLYRVIKEGRVETPGDMFKVFQEALLEAHEGGKTVIHHIAPFPALFELLHESISFENDPNGSELKPKGKWKKYIELFSKLKTPELGQEPSLTLAMVKYWKDVTDSGFIREAPCTTSPSRYVRLLYGRCS